MNIVGYTRVSTDQQATLGVSLEAQEAKLRSYCTAMGWNMIGMYTDPGLSGGTLTKREGLQKALSCLGETADGILVFKLDRLTRSLKDLIFLMETYFSDYRLISVSESLDTGTAAGRLIINILGVVNQFERETISERVKMTMAHLKAKGIKLGQREYGQLPEEAAVVGRIVVFHKNGMTLRSIADQLNEEGIKPKRSNWNATTVRDIINRVASV